VRERLNRFTGSLLLGVLSPELAAQAAVIKLEIAGTSAGTQFGQSVAGVGDLNGDGHPEIVVGAPHASPAGITWAGAAYVISTHTGQILYELDGRRLAGRLGNIVANGGDMNGDGLPEIVISADNTEIRGVGYAGRVYVCSGDQMALLYTIDGDEAFGGFGSALAGIGDIDADGLADMAIGKWGFGQPGKVYVYTRTSPTPTFTIDGPSFFEWLGLALSGAGDVDGDGYDDFVVGAGFASSGGTVLVFSGATHQLLFELNGQALNAHTFGRAVASAGDLDGDGMDDLWIGAPATDIPLISGGKVFAYSVAKTQVLFSINGKVAHELFGDSLANAGDVDGDGTADVVIGGQADVESGVVRAHSGKTGAMLFQLNGAPGDHLGVAVAGAGDVDGDGRADVVVGAPFADPHGVTDVGAVYILGL